MAVKKFGSKYSARFLKEVGKLFGRISLQTAPKALEISQDKDLIEKTLAEILKIIQDN